MEQLVCCVCQQPVANNAPHLGNRAYCAEHWAKLGNNRRSVSRTSVISVAALVIFAAGVAFLVKATAPTLTGAALVVVGAVLAVVPAALWLAFFYVQDRLEPEPKGYVVGVFVLGALVAAAVGIPLVRGLFHVQSWLGKSLWIDLLGSILIVGFVQQFLVYAAVRYSVYPLPEFDERLDGVLYGTAAGLGYATVLNLHYVIASGGVNLAMGVINVVINALAMASFGGILGYFLGRAKFEQEPVWWLSAGLILAAVLNGVFNVVLGQLVRSGSVLGGQTINPWAGLALATVLAVATLAVLLSLMRRASRLTLAGMDMA